MPTYTAVDHVSVTIPHLSGLVKDQVVNTFAFETAVEPDNTAYGVLETALNHFYGSVATGATHAIGEYLGPTMSRTSPPVYRHYRVEGHLTGTPAGSPIRVADAALLPASLSPNTGLPTECSVVLSFHGPYSTDVEFAPGARPRSRDRGRIFVGPLTNSLVACQFDSLTKRPYVSDTMRADLTKAAQALFNELQGTSPVWNWVVWSRKKGDISVISQASVDDGFDTQRRRGEKAIVRTLQAIP